VEELRAALAPWHPYVKAVHVIAAAVWAFSTAVAWVMYLKPALRRAARAPEDAEARARRDRYLELFDRGAILDVYLSHLGGNKAGIRRTGDMARYERMVRHHTTFLRVTEPIVVVIVPLLFVLTIAKPF
jgi:hypothetical protein